jgi:hypothetical protein
MITEDDFRTIRESLESGAISTLPKARLEHFAVVLCHKNAFGFFGNNQFPQICETVRLHLLRAHMDALQKHITDLNKKNTVLQILVIALAAAALMTSAAQIYLQLSPRATPNASGLPAQAAPVAGPTQAPSQSSGQTTTPKP